MRSRSLALLGAVFLALQHFDIELQVRENTARADALDGVFWTEGEKGPAVGRPDSCFLACSRRPGRACWASAVPANTVPSGSTSRAPISAECSSNRGFRPRRRGLLIVRSRERSDSS